MNWEDVCEHPSLQDLPFKIEVNEKGEIVMNAVKVIHSLYQGEIEYILRSLLKGGKALPECAIKTRKGFLRCPVCGDDAAIHPVELSYAFKLLLEELKSLVIEPKLRLRGLV